MRPLISRVLVSAILGIVTASSSCWAKTSVASIENQASVLFQQGKYPEAFAAYQKAALMGSPRSETILGYMYASGKGTAKESYPGAGLGQQGRRAG